jgi:hypothetical protein
MFKISAQFNRSRSLLAITTCFALLIVSALPSQAKPEAINPPIKLSNPKAPLPDYLETLRTANGVASLGFGTAPSPNAIYKSFQQAIGEGKKIKPEIEQILQTGTPIGKLYATGLLMQFDPLAARQILMSMQSDETKFVISDRGLPPEQKSIGAWATGILNGGTEFLPQALPLKIATLKTANRLEGKYLGIAAKPSQLYQAYESVQSIEGIQWYIDRLLVDATPAGQIYTAMLLVKLDPTAGRKALEQMQWDPTDLGVMSGCVQSKTTVGEAVTDILQNRSTVFPRLP